MEDLNSWRQTIDRIDVEIGKLLIRRLNAVRNIAVEKQKLSLEIKDTEREAEVRENACKYSRCKGEDVFINDVYDKIIALSIDAQRKEI